jgi:hypothetical protein
MTKRDQAVTKRPMVNPLVPFIAHDTHEPLVILGGYRVGATGAIIPDAPVRYAGKDYGCDPVANSNPPMFRMVPSGDIVGYAERCKRLTPLA